MRWVAILMLGACGRIAFDPRGDGGGASGDGRGDASGDAGQDLSLLTWFTFESDGFLHDRASSRDATCTSCPGPEEGNTPSSIGAVFNGSTDCIHAPLPLPVRPAQFTIALWSRIDLNGNQTVFGMPYMGDTMTLDTIEIYSASNDQTVVQMNSDMQFFLNTPVGFWHHIAATYDGTTFTPYLDGIATGGGPESAPMYTMDVLQLGCDRDIGTEIDFLDGAVDDVRFYSRALSVAEIAALAQ